LNLKSIKVILVAIMLVAGLSLATGCTTTAQPATTNTAQTTAQPTTTELAGSIVQKGSDTVLLLAQMYAETFMNANPGVTIPVSGGGSSVGIASLIDGTTDIADASREMKSSELDNCAANGVDPVQWKVAIDGITIIVNPDNPVNGLTTEQLRDIYLGIITNWNEVGGPDMDIILFGRQSTSGTYEFIKVNVLEKQNFSPAVQEQTGNAQIANMVALTEGGIGYCGVGYVASRTDVRGLEIDGVAPDVGTINDGSYPLWRYLYMYTDGVPTESGNVALYHYLHFIINDGQELNDDVDYLPLSSTVQDEMIAQLG